MWVRLSEAFLYTVAVDFVVVFVDVGAVVAH